MKAIIFIILSMYCVSIYAENTSSIYATYNVEAEKTAHLAFSHGGIINTVLVDITSVVKADDLLATLENDDLIATTNTLNIALKYALLDYERHKALYNRKLIDKALLEKYTHAFENAKAQIKYHQTIIDKTRLKAPFNGVITHKLIETGDVVSGQFLKTVLQIQSTHKRKIIIEFDQKYHHLVHAGDIFKYQVEGDTKQLTGIITKIYPYINVSNRKIKAEVMATDLTVGLYGEGSIIINK